MYSTLLAASCIYICISTHSFITWEAARKIHYSNPHSFDLRRIYINYTFIFQRNCSGDPVFGAVSQ